MVVDIIREANTYQNKFQDTLNDKIKEGWTPVWETFRTEIIQSTLNYIIMIRKD